MSKRFKDHPEEEEWYHEMMELYPTWDPRRETLDEHIETNRLEEEARICGEMEYEDEGWEATEGWSLPEANAQPHAFGPS
jgi:hypothetical protein